MTSGHMLQQLDSEMTRVSERLDICASANSQRLAAERAEQEEILSLAQSEIDDSRSSNAAQTRTADRSRDRNLLTALRQRREEAAQTARQHAARVATLEERHRSAASRAAAHRILVRGNGRARARARLAD